jgi:hypothetical protein
MDSRSTLETTCRRSWRTVEGDRCRICGAFLAMARLAWGMAQGLSGRVPQPPADRSHGTTQGVAMFRGVWGKTPNMWRHCLSKLQAKDRTHAAVIGVRRGLVIPERHGPQTSKTPEQRPGVMNESRTFQWQWSGEAAGVGTWGRTFQVWGGWFSWGT